MFQVTMAMLNKVAKNKTVNVSNATSVLTAMNTYGEKVGLNRAHRIAQYLAQIMHESGEFYYDREIWGKVPTRAQRGYEGRKDLGNVYKGDGYKYRGRTELQITGRANTTAYRDWCKALKLPIPVPDFVANPDLMNTDPWEGLGPIWFWDTRHLNTFADVGDIETISIRINGGHNGYVDRCDYYTRCGLVFLGYPPNGIKAFQTASKMKVIDGIVGPATRMAIHNALVAIP